VIECAGNVSRDDSERLESRIVDWLGGCEDPVGIKKIVEALATPETTIRKLLDRLVSSGKVIRGNDPHHSQRLLFRLPVPEEKPGYPEGGVGRDDVTGGPPDVESGLESSDQT
jgi:predicted transcriptional regulator